MVSWDFIPLFVNWETVADDIWRPSISNNSTFLNLFFSSFFPRICSHRYESESLKAHSGLESGLCEKYFMWKLTLFA